MDGFGTIRLDHRTIKRFRRFSKKITKSYSETWELVMDFFEWHGILPSSKFPKRVDEDGEKTRKRINALIAIVRDIEKTQTLPTNEMLLALFGQHKIVKKSRQPIREEKKFKKLTKEEWNELKGMIPKERFDRLKERHKIEKQEVLQFLLKVKWVKPRFGSPYWKIDTNATELAAIKNKMQRD
ncbi:BfmA/BtgA family mobilization protein [Croceitalea rosinachiae]|uniref:BfmA/BtgA family mobilization protein n=1 Tax=Croceitalea rosinachiae TaxID=3075596 RepID=A0ABU3A814_9FLAO|nr:BfmA/BtgA family mobilization protein [Croceitalea sp. F388]MDT0606306.1 BfmA/BtgA family mobilization protein [Croceitalea sp. F388]